MLLRRCAWHRYYRGYAFLYGVARWRGLRPSFTDGVCGRCAKRLRRDLELPPARWPSLATRRTGVEPLAVPPGAVALIALAVLLSLARPLDAPPPMVPAGLPAALTPRPMVVSPAAPAEPRMVDHRVVDRRVVERRPMTERRPAIAPRRASDKPLKRIATADIAPPLARSTVMTIAAPAPRAVFPRVRGADSQAQ